MPDSSVCRVGNERQGTMGYDVSVALRDAGQRQAYDEAATRLGIPHEIETWGDGEPSEWAVKTLWSGGSMMRELGDWLCEKGTRIDGGDAYCPDYAIGTDVLAALHGIRKELGEARETSPHVPVVETLGMLDDEGSWEYWNALERGTIEVLEGYVPVPVARSIDVPDARGHIVRDDSEATVPSGHKQAWDARIRLMGAERALEDADEDARADAEAKVRVMREAYEAVRPHQDTVDIRLGRMEVATYDHDVHVELTRRDPARGARFKAAVIKAIADSVSDPYDTERLYDILTENPAVMLATFERLGEVWRAADKAGITELAVCPSW